MRICSLLPSITETLFELGLADQVVGVTHECDWPAAARDRPKLTRSRIHTSGSSSAEIDRLVREQAGSLYELDAELITRLEPDLIFTQSLCPVCAVDEVVVRRLAAVLPSRPRVVSFHPTCLDDVYRMIQEVGVSTGATAAAQHLIARFDREIATIRHGLDADRATPAVVLLEWTDPPFACGHWTPELIERAGGKELLGMPGQESRRVTWGELRSADPKILVVAPCGFTLDRALEDIEPLEALREWTSLSAVQSGQVFVCDGSAYFNRPGPRLVDSLRILAEALHPMLFRGLAPAGSFQQVPAIMRNNQ